MYKQFAYNIVRLYCIKVSCSVLQIMQKYVSLSSRFIRDGVLWEHNHHNTSKPDY